MVNPKCIICGTDLKDNEGYDGDGNLVEQQVKYYMHDPNDLHRDVLVTAHKDCFDKAKKVSAAIGKPTQTDLANPKFAVIENDAVVLKTVTELKEFQSKKIINEVSELK